MKKVAFLLVLFLIIISVQAKPKLKFRFECDKQTGICIRFGIENDTDDILTLAEIEEGFGFLQFKIENGKFKITPEVPMSSTTTVVIPEDWDVGNFAAQELGFKNLIVKKGIYSINSSEGAFGSVSLDFTGTR